MAPNGLALLCTRSRRTFRTILKLQAKTKRPIIQIIPDFWRTNMEIARPEQSSKISRRGRSFLLTQTRGAFYRRQTSRLSKAAFRVCRYAEALAPLWGTRWFKKVSIGVFLICVEGGNGQQSDLTLAMTHDTRAHGSKRVWLESNHFKKSKWRR
jgi:hypothetical protein